MFAKIKPYLVTAAVVLAVLAVVKRLPASIKSQLV
jgi:negative regulator of sigma E activity